MSRLSNQPKSAEISVDTGLNLNDLVKNLNGFFLEASFLLLNDETKKTAQEIIEKLLLSIQKSDTKTNAAILTTISNKTENHPFLKLKKASGINFYTSNHKNLFGILSKNETNYIEPWIGDKDNGSSLLYNKDLVIGLIFKCGPFTIRYRLDYDPIKKLHINIDFLDGEKEYNFALTNIQDPKRYYNVKESVHLHELIKFKFCIKMTHSYHNTFNIHKNNSFDQFLASINAALNEDDNDIMGIKETRDEVIAQLIQSYTKNRSDKKSRIGHDIELNTENSENNTASESSDDDKKKKSKKSISNLKTAGLYSKNASNNNKKEIKSVSENKKYLTI